jgi:hypothetical protein
MLNNREVLVGLLPEFWKNLQRIFCISLIWGCSHQKEHKNVENVPLDVQKLGGAAENEPFQISDFDRSAVLHISVTTLVSSV